MKNVIIKILLAIIIVTAFSFTMTSCNHSGEAKTTLQSQNEQMKYETIEKINQIYEVAAYNQGGIRSILTFSSRASTNFDTFVYLAEMANEFGYHTDAFVYIARYASKAKVETDYFKRLADLSVMKLSETKKVEMIACDISKLKTPTSAEIENELQKFRNAADFKTLDEAKAYNKSICNFKKQ